MHAKERIEQRAPEKQNKERRTPSLRSLTRSLTSRPLASIFVLSHFVNVFCWTVIQCCCSAKAILVRSFSWGGAPGSVAARAVWRDWGFVPFLKRRALPARRRRREATSSGSRSFLWPSLSLSSAAGSFAKLWEAARFWRRAACSCLAFSRLRVSGRCGEFACDCGSQEREEEGDEVREWHGGC